MKPRGRTAAGALVIVVLVGAGITAGQPQGREPFEAAATAAAAGDGEAALRLLAESCDAGAAGPSRALAAPAFDALRRDPALRQRLSALVKRCARGSEVRMVSPAEPGVPLAVHGTVVDAGGQPVAGARVTLYQTADGGLYAPEHERAGFGSNNPRLTATVVTDGQGRFEARTVLPGPYPGGGVARHVHYEVEAAGHGRVVAEFLFDDDPVLRPDLRAHAARNGWPIVKREPEGSGSRCAVTIRLTPGGMAH
jgi:hypothetical protein